MSAMQHSSQTYQKAHIPSVTLPLRYGKISNVEHLDAHRAKKLQDGLIKKKQEDNLEKIKELEVYYNMRRNSISTNDGPRRKLDVSMVGVLFPDNNITDDQKKKTKKLSIKKSAKKRKVKVYDLVYPRDDAFKKQKRTKFKNTFSALLTIMVVFTMLSMILIRDAEISNQTYQNAQTEKKIQNLEMEISKLDMDRALKEDLTSVQYAAASKGMTRPTDEQVVFMTVNPELPDKYNLDESENSDAVANDNDFVSVTDSTNTSTDNEANNSIGPIEVINTFFDKVGKTFQGWLN